MSVAPDVPGAGPGRGARAPLLHRRDAVIAGLIVAAAALLLYVTTTFETVPALLAQNIGPESFPRSS
jgi:hypothetical protein